MLQTQTTPTDVTAQASKHPDTTEGTPSAPEATATQTTPDPLSPKYAALARREKQIREREMAAKAERDAWEKEREALLAKAQKADTWQQRLTQDPYQVMLEAGLTADQAAALMLKQPDPQMQVIDQLRAEIAALKGETESVKTAAQEAQARQYEQAKKQIRADVSSLIDADASEAYEAIKANGEFAKDAVVDLIEKTFQKDGYLMTVDQAAQEVEEYLLEQAMGMAKLKKVQGKLIPAASQTTQTDTPKTTGAQPQQRQTQTPIQTLSNRTTPSAPASSRLSEKERVARAIAAFRGQSAS